MKAWLMSRVTVLASVTSLGLLASLAALAGAPDQPVMPSDLYGPRLTMLA